MAYVPAEDLSQPPVPTANPLQDGGHPSLVWRRLGVSVWLDAQGKVVDAKVSRYEISDELARQLEQAVAAIRFTPGMRDGQAVPTIVESRLCFDGSGQLDTSGDRCWGARQAAPQPAPPPTPQPAAQPAPEAAQPAPQR